MLVRVRIAVLLGGCAALDSTPGLTYRVGVGDEES